MAKKKEATGGNMTKNVLIPMTVDQHKKIKAKADEMGLPVTAYMRLKALED